jgi:hypothetical protein
MTADAKNFCSNAVGNARQPMEPIGPQAALRLAFGVHHAATNAPQSLVGQCETASQALAVAILAGHHKLDYIAACIGKSRGHVSRMQNGKRAIPEHLIDPLCAATGTNLLRQWMDLHHAMDGINEIERLAAILRNAA